MTNAIESLDLLAVGAHPDDVDLGVGGMLHKFARQGRRVGILDLTRGEMGSRGTPEERDLEAQNAAGILGVAVRDNARLPDGAVANTSEQQFRVISFIRKYRPRILLATMEKDRHPDHHAAHALVRDAAYFSGLQKIVTECPPYRPPCIYYYHPYEEARIPDLIVDISDDFEAKLAALRAHASQFHNPNYSGPTTRIASPEFWDSIQTRAAYWGSRIQVRYAEALYSNSPVAVTMLPGLEVLP